MSYIGNGPGVASQRVESAFTATAAQQDFTPTSGYTLGYCDVYQNGVKLVNGDDYTATNGVTVSLTTGAALGDSIVIVASFPRGLSDGYLKSEADARYAQIDTNTLYVDTTNHRLGIGTSSPSYKLDITGPGTANGTTLRLNDQSSSANSKHLLLSRGSSTASIGVAGSQANDPLWLSRSGGYDVLVDNGGYVGLNVVPTARLTIGLQSYNVSATSGMIRFKNDQNTADGCIQSYSVGANIGTDIFIGSNVYVDTAGSFVRFNTSRESSYLTVSRDGTIYMGSGGTGATAVTRASLDTSGNLTLNTGNLVLASGKGIDFSAHSNASGMSSELLDDYEQGTWTISLTPIGGGSYTLSNNTGHYTKVGRLVTVGGQFMITSVSSPTGSYANLSLPFTASTLSGSGTGRFGPPISMVPGGGNWGVYATGISDGSTNMVIELAAASFGTATLRFSFSYFV